MPVGMVSAGSHWVACPLSGGGDGNDPGRHCATNAHGRVPEFPLSPGSSLTRTRFPPPPRTHRATYGRRLGLPDAIPRIDRRFDRPGQPHTRGEGFAAFIQRGDPAAAFLSGQGGGVRGSNPSFGTLGRETMTRNMVPSPRLGTAPEGRLKV